MFFRYSFPVVSVALAHGFYGVLWHSVLKALFGARFKIVCDLINYTGQGLIIDCRAI